MSQPSSNEIVGIDIGGANLKYASSQGVAYSRRFEMWRRSDSLADTVAQDLCKWFGPRRTLAITMTGELADCFVDRGEGVEHIVRHVSDAATRVESTDVHYYGVDGQFHSAAAARQEVDLIAAANWHALASFVGREIAGDAILVDIGSTTTDIIPIQDRRVATDAQTDHDRMREGTLVYVGCRRTPVASLVDQLRYQGSDTAVMNESFATIDDARVVLGLQEERADDRETADGQPRTREMAANRLARMIGLDRRSVSVEDAKEMAVCVLQAAKGRIRDSLDRWATEDSLLVLSGHGEDLIDLPSCGARSQIAEDQVAEKQRDMVVRLADRLGPEISRCAPSYAVAQLLRLSNPSCFHWQTSECVIESCEE